MKIHLHGGPWNGKWIRNSGKVLIRLTIASAWRKTPRGSRPIPGSSTGLAIYEANDRWAFWLKNEWDDAPTQIIEL